MASMLRNVVAGMSAREKRLATLAGFAVVAFGVFLVIFFVRSAIGEVVFENESRANLLRDLEVKGPHYLQQRQDLSRTEPRGKPVPLQSLVDSTSQKVGVMTPDTKALPEQRHGDVWVENSMEISLREVGLEQLTKFMETIEGNRRQFPVAITKLELRKRRRGEDSFDVKMTISTYEQLTPPAGAGVGKADDAAAAARRRDR
ncbi:MAG TPA: hypothetical protein VM285_09770 [Polyangia bacterium]|nr:hypothetical protein [Polyangia bacterium]